MAPKANEKGPVSVEMRDSVAVISMSNPPVNALAIPGASPVPASSRDAAGTHCLLFQPRNTTLPTLTIS